METLISGIKNGIITNASDFVNMHKKVTSFKTQLHELKKNNLHLTISRSITCGGFYESIRHLYLPGVKKMFKLLKDPSKIPKDWEGKYLFFFGDIFMDKDSDQFVLFLYSDNNQWTLGKCYFYHFLNLKTDFAVLYLEYEKLINEEWKVYQNGDKVLLQKENLRILFNKKRDYVHLKFEVISAKKIKLIEY